MTLLDDYGLLEIPATATTDQVKRAYHQLLQVWHPDRFEHDAGLRARAEEKTKAIVAAFNRIKDAPLSQLGAPDGPSPVASTRNASQPTRPAVRHVPRGPHHALQVVAIPLGLVGAVIVALSFVENPAAMWVGIFWLAVAASLWVTGARRRR